MNRWMRALAVAALAGVLAAGTVRADEIDDAAALPVAQALERLEALLAATPEQPDGAARRGRIRALLGRLYVQAGQPYAALSHLDAALRATGAPADRVAYGEALLATARAHIADQGPGRSVTPFLRDTLGALEPLDLAPAGGLDAGLRTRAAFARMDACYLLGENDQAAAVYEGVQPATLPEAGRRALDDMLGRVRYQQERWEEAAAAFEAAGSDLGAAAAWDAARKPERSIPLYARRIAAAPGDRQVLEQALRGARYTGAHAQMADALAKLPVPEGTAGVELLLARADLLEAAGRPADALPLLRDAVIRTDADARPLLGLARLTLLASDPENEDAWDAAADAYIGALERDPEGDPAAQGLNWIAQRDFGRLWSTWRDGRVGRRCLRVQEALVKAAPDDALAWANLGNTLRVLGLHQEALDAYAQAIEANPFDPAVLSDRGLAHSAAGHPDAALADFEASVKLDDGHLAGHQNAARVRWLRGDDDGAAAHLGAALRTVRAVGSSAGSYRFLLDRIWRTRRNPALR